MNVKPILLALSCVMTTSYAVHATDNQSESPIESFKLPTELVNDQPIPGTKQDLFEAAKRGVKFNTTAPTPAMETLNTMEEVNRIANNKSGNLMSERDFPEYVDRQIQAATVSEGPSYSFLEVVKSKYKPIQELKNLKPGANIAIPVAVGLTNPIITNFKMVAARTHDEDSVIQLEDGRVYITLNSLKPVALMLFEEGVPESMINLTLIPMEAMPVIVNAHIELTQSMTYKGIEHRRDLKEREAIAKAVDNNPAANNESERVGRIKQILKPIGRGEIPQGFTLSHDISKAMAKPCGLTISQKVMQRIVGSREVVDVVRIQNTKQRPYSIREQMCEARDVMAVAIYNKSILQPGEATEVYILRDKAPKSAVNTNSKRPRVIN